MLVKMNTSVAGINWSADAGQIVDLKDDEAKRFIKAGYATAVIAPKENAAINTKAPEPRRRREK